MSKIKEQPIPKWFNGHIYDKGGANKNRREG